MGLICVPWGSKTFREVYSEGFRSVPGVFKGFKERFYGSHGCSMEFKGFRVFQGVCQRIPEVVKGFHRYSKGFPGIPGAFQKRCVGVSKGFQGR